MGNEALAIKLAETLSELVKLDQGDCDEVLAKAEDYLAKTDLHFSQRDLVQKALNIFFYGE